MALQAGQVYRVGPTTVNIFRPPPGGLLDAQLEYHWTGVAGDSMEKESQSGVLLQQEDDSAGSLVQAFSGGSAADGHGSALCQKEVRMTVGGITLTPAVWKHAFDPEGYEWDPAEDKAAAVALGYVAHLVDKLACYLGVPLRYPIQTRGSTSAVLDKYPPAGTWYVIILIIMHSFRVEAFLVFTTIIIFIHYFVCNSIAGLLWKLQVVCMGHPRAGSR